MLTRFLLAALLTTMAAIPNTSQTTPPIEPGVSLELAKWRAARYSDVRYKLNLTLEKMSPVLKGTIEIRVKVSEPPASAGGQKGDDPAPPIILDWRPIKGHEERSTISNVSINGRSSDTPVRMSVASTRTSADGPETSIDGDSFAGGTGDADKSVRAPRESSVRAPFEINEHLVFRDGVVIGENVIQLDFTSPILASGSAITRYIDKEDGSEYIYSLFVPSDASTAFPVFDQPDLKASFQLSATVPFGWKIVSNSAAEDFGGVTEDQNRKFINEHVYFERTKPISTYVFAFAAGEFTEVRGQLPASTASERDFEGNLESRTVALSRTSATNIYVRRSQAEKFKPHAAEVFRLNREAVKYFEEYFDYKFPFPKYDLVLIPEFPFGGMEHAGATFLRESAIIFPQEPTKNDHISRALLIFHEAAHQWFGDTVTMRWFDDLWLKEGFATFTAYKAMERIMPEMMAWKVFYERVKQAAYQTDSTKGTTPIYQEIPNLSAAKSAYGNIVYNKAPAFLRQAEFYLGEDEFRTAVRAFLKKQEFGNAGWEDLVSEFELVSNKDLKAWADVWVTRRGLPKMRTGEIVTSKFGVDLIDTEQVGLIEQIIRPMNVQYLIKPSKGKYRVELVQMQGGSNTFKLSGGSISAERKSLSLRAEKPFRDTQIVFPNYQDYGYGIFLLDEKSREYVLKNIQNEKDPFLRSMMWGALWDSVREGELDPREYVELVLNVLMQKPAREQGHNEQRPDTALANVRASAVEDESTTALLLSRIGTAMNYYIDDGVGGPETKGGNLSGSEGVSSSPSKNTLPTGRVSASGADLRARAEGLLIERMRNAETLGQRITYYRAFLNIAASENARKVLKEMLAGEEVSRKAAKTQSGEGKSEPPASAGGQSANAGSTLGATTGADRSGRVSGPPNWPAAHAAGSDRLPLKTKDKFDIVTRLLILGDPEAEGLLAGLEKVETSDDAKRYAYAARAGIGTAENKAKYWNDFVNNKEISESWIEAALGPWNSIRHSEMTLPYLERALKELPNHKRNRKIFFVNGWLGAFIGGQRSEEALNIVNKFLADNPTLDKDLKLKILENADIIERAVKIRK